MNGKLATTLGYNTLEEALGEKLKYTRGMEFKIIGVVDDFHTVSFHNPTENVILPNLPWDIFELTVKINAGSGNLAPLQIFTISSTPAIFDLRA